jgi:hypothetical protein
MGWLANLGVLLQAANKVAAEMAATKAPSLFIFSSSQ